MVGTNVTVLALSQVKFEYWPDGVTDVMVPAVPDPFLTSKVQVEVWFNVTINDLPSAAVLVIVTPVVPS